MSEIVVTVKLSLSQRGILLALAKKELARTRAGLDDKARPLAEDDRAMLQRYAANLEAALAAMREGA
ncbi:MAG: hypothetical protein U0942_15935 [Parvibaculum sp.]|uniref:hypothetical protein n=1 Tax=Parvibaculum sp. TaxID=2024848 RepID=UPI002AB82733|nr:hypothetical protein [Parvibaculum sp.]MDZ4382822.1 hypothetical protein [Parvibaculum sp.]